jgi:hypothetical protein
MVMIARGSARNTGAGLPGRERAEHEKAGSYSHCLRVYLAAEKLLIALGNGLRRKGRTQACHAARGESKSQV